MRLSTFSDYSLRVLMYLGVHQEGLVTIGEIALAFQISENHLMKVVHHLGKAGYIDTVRGKGGGMRLGRKPRSILIGDLIRLTENDLYLVECMEPDSDCRIIGKCKLQRLMGDALEAMFVVLNRHTLADLISRPMNHTLNLLRAQTVA